MSNFLQDHVGLIADYVAANPIPGSAIVFLLALSESLPVIGAVAPGTAIILAIAALAGLGYMPVWAVLLAAVLGAVAGDGLSYWIGHYYKDRALEMWPLSRYPAMIRTSEEFFARHGGKSILIARFTPVVRAFVPLIAGMSGMNPARFYSANIASAIIWGVSHVLPAAAFGASLLVLHQISGRLVALAIAVAVLGYVLTVLMRRGILLGGAAFSSLLSRAHAALRDRPGRLPALLRELTHPEDGEAREIAFLGIIVAAALLATIILVDNLLVRGEPMPADRTISTIVSQLRTGWGDSIMVAITILGDTPVTGLVAFIAAGWILWKRQWQLAMGFLIAAMATTLFVVGLKFTTQITRPIPIYHGTDAFSFPSGHTAFAAALYGILGWIWSRDLDRPWNTIVVFATSFLVAAIGISRIYLQAHWPSDVLAGLVFGFGLTAAFALAFRHVDLSPLHARAMLAITLAAFLVIGPLRVVNTHAESMTMYARHVETLRMSTAAWRHSGWQELPRRRLDLMGEREEPIILQWSGTPDELAAALRPHGWRPAVDLSIVSAGAYLRGDTVPEALPVLPRLNDGRAPVLSLVRPTPGGRDVLNMWKSNVHLVDRRGEPLLVGAVISESVAHPLPFITIPTGLRPANADVVGQLRNELPNVQSVVRPAPAQTAELPAALLLAGP